ncbi:unnamed protein product [Urochloa humidicola]
MEEEKKKLSITIACKSRPTNPPSGPAAADDVPNPNSAPTGLQFVTEFDPSQTTLPPAAAAPVVVAPLPNSFNFGRRRNPSSVPTSEEEAALAAISPAGGGPAFVLDASTASDADPSNTSYGLTLRNADDMEDLPKTSEREFAVAVLAGYGWSQGQCVGKNHRNRKEDAKAIQYGC